MESALSHQFPTVKIAPPGGPTQAQDRLIIALDFASADAALELVARLDGECRWFKVGMELYCAAGNTVVERLLASDCKVFLDLKLHDIPNTVAGAVRSVAALGASLLTIHASGGERMMRAAAEAAAAIPDAPRLLAVSILTSMDAADLIDVGIAGTPDATRSQVLRLARLARTAGIDGLVCSPDEVAAVREVMGPAALLVTPGVRAADNSSDSYSAGQATGPQSTGLQSTGQKSTSPQSGGLQSGGDDQRRVATPAQAIARGASMLVVGRPITRAADPAAAARAILAEIAASA